MRRVPGSNQYQTRTKSSLAFESGPDLVAAVADVRRRCGDVWGTKCRAWVYPPDFAHLWRNTNMHPTINHMFDMANDSSVLDQSQQEQLATAILANCQSPMGRVTLSPSAALSICAIENLSSRWFLRTVATDGVQPLNPLVGRSLAEHKACPPDVLHELAMYPDSMVRWGVVRNANVRAETIVLLINDNDPDVRHRAREHPRLPEEYRGLMHIIR